MHTPRHIRTYAVSWLQFGSHQCGTTFFVLDGKAVFLGGRGESLLFVTQQAGSSHLKQSFNFLWLCGWCDMISLRVKWSTLKFHWSRNEMFSESTISPERKGIKINSSLRRAGTAGNVIKNCTPPHNSLFSFTFNCCQVGLKRHFELLIQ